MPAAYTDPTTLPSHSELLRWVVRTLSANDVRYNPIDYQVGSIWPHDNALVVAGMAHYGYAGEAQRVFSAMLDAAESFEHYRLPETFAGYPRDGSARPVHYPVACSPQAWAAAAIPFMLQVSLGLQPDAFAHRLRVERPTLPTRLNWLCVHSLRVGAEQVDLHFERSGDTTLVAVDHKDPALTVEVVYRCGVVMPG